MPDAWNVDAIRDLLASRADAVERAIIALWERQTSKEREGHRLDKRDGLGFNQFDANTFAPYAQAILLASYRGARPGTILSPSQLEVARKRLPKYAQQLAEIALERGSQIRRLTRRHAAA